MSKLPTLEQAEEYFDKCMYCGCRDWDSTCRCPIDCHVMAAMAVLKNKEDSHE